MLTSRSITLTVGVGFFLFTTYHCLGFGSRSALWSGPWIGGVSVRRQSDLRLIYRDTICPAFRSGFQILLKNKCMAIRKGTELPPTCSFPPTSSPPPMWLPVTHCIPEVKRLGAFQTSLQGLVNATWKHLPSLCSPCKQCFPLWNYKLSIVLKLIFCRWNVVGGS